MCLCVPALPEGFFGVSGIRVKVFPCIFFPAFVIPRYFGSVLVFRDRSSSSSGTIFNSVEARGELNL